MGVPALVFKRVAFKIDDSGLQLQLHSLSFSPRAHEKREEGAVIALSGGEGSFIFNLTHCFALHRSEKKEEVVRFRVLQTEAA